VDNVLETKAAGVDISLLHGTDNNVKRSIRQLNQNVHFYFYI